MVEFEDEIRQVIGDYMFDNYKSILNSIKKYGLDLFFRVSDKGDKLSYTLGIDMPNYCFNLTFRYKRNPIFQVANKTTRETCHVPMLLTPQVGDAIIISLNQFLFDNIK